MLKTVSGAVSAGVMIAIGGSVFLACENRYAGAVLFSVALLCVCYLGYYLFTGKIGYVVKDASPKNLQFLLVGLLVNLAVTFFLGRVVQYAVPSLQEKAVTLCSAKLEQNFFATLIRGIFCGMLMFLAVEIYIQKKTPIGILFCIPVFILSGFEHSVADMFYFGASEIMDTKILTFELAAVLGNSAGSILMALIPKIGDKNAKKND